MNELTYWEKRDFEAFLPWLEHSDWGNWLAIFDYALDEQDYNFCRRCIRGARKVANTPEAQTWVRYKEAMLFLAEGDLERAEQGLLFAQANLSERELDVHFDILEDLGRLYRTNGNIQKALEVHKKQLIEAEERFDSESIGAVHHNLGSDYLDIEDFKSAETHLNHALTYLKQTGKQNSIAFAEMTLANLYRDQKRLTEAKTLLHQALNRLQLTDNVDDYSLIGNIKGTLGSIYLVQEQLDDAEKMLQDALTITMELKEPSISFVPLYSALGALALKRQDWGGAEFWYAETIALAREWDFQTGLRDALENLALTYQKQSKFDKTQPLYDEAMAIAENQGNVPAYKRLKKSKARTRKLRFFNRVKQRFR